MCLSGKGIGIWAVGSEALLGIRMNTFIVMCWGELFLPCASVLAILSVVVFITGLSHCLDVGALIGRCAAKHLLAQPPTAMHARWQDVVHLIKDAGFLFPLSEGEVTVVPPCFFMLQVATQESWGMRWSVHFKGTECT